MGEGAEIEFLEIVFLMKKTNIRGLDIFKEARDFEQKGLFWQASENYQKALAKFNLAEKQKWKDERNLCKRKIREMNLARSKEFSHIPIEISLNAKEVSQLEELQKLLDKKNLTEVFDYIGKSTMFCPNFQSIKKQGERPPLGLLLSTADTQDESGNLLKDGHDPSVSWFHAVYNLEQIKVTYCILTPLLMRIINKRKVTGDNFTDYFSSKQIFSDDFLTLSHVAIDRFIRQDYVSSLSILTPKIESIFLDITSQMKIGKSLIAAKKQKACSEKFHTQDITLGEGDFDDKEIRQEWGENLCEQLKFVLFSQLGWKIRHRVAHGKMDNPSFNVYNASTILYFFIVFAARTRRNK